MNYSRLEILVWACTLLMLLRCFLDHNVDGFVQILAVIAVYLLATKN